MKTIVILLVGLGLSACGTGARNEAAANQVTSTDAVTAEAIRDTKAAEGDAMNAADAELDNLGNSIDDGADADNRVSNGTAVVRY